MGKVEDALRDLILYHSKRAATEALGDMPAQVRRARRGMRALQKAVEELSAQVRKLLEARRREMAVPPAPEAETGKVRFTKRTLKSLRQRFDLTQQELAKLLEVSPVTITSWETGKSRPRKANLAPIVTLRNMAPPQVDEALGRAPAPRLLTPQQLKRLRKKLSLTQAGLAKLVGVSTASVTSWEAGKTAAGRDSRRVIAELKKALRGQVDERLGRRPAAPARTPRAGGGAPSPAQIKAIRTKAGLSQRQLARKLKVSVNSVSNWETGRSVPRSRTVQKLLSLRGKR